MTDLLGALLVLVLASPVFLVTAILIKIHDGGPVLFWQTRIGRWGRPFRFPKFRSMVLDAEQRKATLLAQNDHGNTVTFKMKRDPRITPVGRWIRRLSIDELPQLWCVLRGDMALVGPRPPVPREVASYTPADRRRLDVVPGLTCIWQVSGRGEIPFPEQVKLDVEYIEHHTVRFDVRLLLKTVPAVLFGRGAY
jgi:lipopolysaccharide/colanic/teichoic acid biosynthesis glycosyltransferase